MKVRFRFHVYSFWVVMFGWHPPTTGFWVRSGIVVESELEPLDGASAHSV